MKTALAAAALSLASLASPVAAHAWGRGGGWHGGGGGYRYAQPVYAPRYAPAPYYAPQYAQPVYAPTYYPRNEGWRGGGYGYGRGYGWHGGGRRW